ncbi:hypothetical protein [Kitasatospora herbaricolor]|uniref:Uncharacterized protein n=1 Tax=Kitasatospora herbaricolor TaxID=68217 RepID=A0ABZ1WDC3_9ACTN|nr:hypothetical protein [Kitasatospora herbaricolor]
MRRRAEPGHLAGVGPVLDARQVGGQQPGGVLQGPAERLGEGTVGGPQIGAPQPERGQWPDAAGPPDGERGQFGGASAARHADQHGDGGLRFLPDQPVRPVDPVGGQVRDGARAGARRGQLGGGQPEHAAEVERPPVAGHPGRVAGEQRGQRGVGRVRDDGEGRPGVLLGRVGAPQRGGEDAEDGAAARVQHRGARRRRAVRLRQIEQQGSPDHLESAAPGVHRGGAAEHPAGERGGPLLPAGERQHGDRPAGRRGRGAGPAGQARHGARAAGLGGGDRQRGQRQPADRGGAQQRESGGGQRQDAVRPEHPGLAAGEVQDHPVEAGHHLVRGEDGALRVGDEAEAAQAAVQVVDPQQGPSRLRGRSAAPATRHARRPSRWAVRAPERPVPAVVPGRPEPARRRARATPYAPFTTPVHLARSPVRVSAPLPAGRQRRTGPGNAGSPYADGTRVRAFQGEQAAGRPPRQPTKTATGRA